MLGLTEGRVRELEQKLDGARTAAETAELALQQHKERSGNYQSVQACLLNFPTYLGKVQ